MRVKGTPAVFAANRLEFDLFQKRVTAGPRRFFVLDAPANENKRLNPHECEVIDLYNFITRETASHSWRDAWEICRQVGGRIRACALEDETPVDNVADDLAYSLVYLFNVNAAVRRALSEYPTTCVMAGSQMRDPVYWDTPSPSADLFHAAVWWACQDLQLPWTGLADEIAATGRFDEYMWSPPATIDFTLPCKLSICESAISLYERGEFHEYVERSDQRSSWVCMSDIDPDCALPCVNWSLIRKLPFTDPNRDCSPKLRDLFLEEVEAHHPAREHLLRNPNLNFLWQAAQMWIRGCRHEFRLGRFIARALQPCVAITPYDVQGYRRSLRAGLEREGVPTISVLHGGLCHPPALIRLRNSCGKMAVWGRWDEEQIGRWQTTKSQFLRTGCMRPDLTALAEARSVNTPQKGYVLILTAQPRAPYTSGVVDPTDAIASWRALAAYVKSRAEWQFVIKLHPRFDTPDLYRDLFADVANVIISSEPMASWLPRVQVAIMLNQMTTAALEVMMAGIPLIVHEPSVDEAYRGLLHPGACHVASLQELDARLQLLMSDVELRKEQASLAADTVRYVVEAFGDRAAENLIREAEAIARDPNASEPRHWQNEYRLFQLINLTALAASPPHPWNAGPLNLHEAKWRRLIRSKSGNFECELIECPEQLEPCLFDVLLWSKWRDAENRVHSLPQLIWRIHRATPSAIRVSFRRLRGYLLTGFDRDLEQWPSRLGVYAWLLPVILLSPTRMLRALRAVFAKKNRKPHADSEMR